MAKTGWESKPDPWWTTSTQRRKHRISQTTNKHKQRDKPVVSPEHMTPNLDQQNTAINPTVELTRTDADNIEENIRRYSDIGLDWYVPNLSNTHVRDLIQDRLPISTGRGKILFNCPQLREFFTTSTFKVDLTTGQVYMYLQPPEDIGAPCQQDKFDLNLLRDHFQRHTDPVECHTEKLNRIPLIRKNSSCNGHHGHGRDQGKIGQYCQLWELYAEASCELTRKSKLSQEEAARTCKVYRLYIRDVLQQVDAAITIFMMEKELRSLKGRGHFPIPTITTHGTRIENPHQVRKILESVDEEVVWILTTVRESERT